MQENKHTIETKNEQWCKAIFWFPVMPRLPVVYSSEPWEISHASTSDTMSAFENYIHLHSNKFKFRSSRLWFFPCFDSGWSQRLNHTRLCWRNCFDTCISNLIRFARFPLRTALLVSAWGRLMRRIPQRFSLQKGLGARTTEENNLIIGAK